MLELPDVTLVMIETMEHELARLSVQECVSKVKFGDVLICTDKPELFEPLDCKPRFHIVENWPDKIGWSRFSWFGVPPLINTRQTLYIQWDAWVWDVDMWRDEYLKYDIIGAPWWYKDGRNVGNLGFAIRSKALIQYVYDHRDRYPCVTATDDDLLCRKYRSSLEEAGFVWAPERVARDFAFECVRPSPDSRHFGFHALFNFPYVIDDKEKLMERLRLAYRSPYINKDGYMWGGFASKHPELVAELEREPHAPGSVLPKGKVHFASAVIDLKLSDEVKEELKAGYQEMQRAMEDEEASSDRNGFQEMAPIEGVVAPPGFGLMDQANNQGDEGTLGPSCPGAVGVDCDPLATPERMTEEEFLRVLKSEGIALPDEKAPS